MSDLSKFSEYLSELIQEESFSLASEITDQEGHLSLVESQKGLRDRYVKIKNVPSDVQIIKIDNFDLQGNFIRTSGDLPFGKRCDYLLIDSQLSRLILIELKLGTNRVRPEHVISQLKGGRAAVDYMVALLQHFKNEDFYIDPKYFRYIWISYSQRDAKQEMSNRGQDIEKPRKLKDAHRTIFDYKVLIR